jgi:hypothetical protein
MGSSGVCVGNILLNCLVPLGLGQSHFSIYYGVSNLSFSITDGIVGDIGCAGNGTSSMKTSSEQQRESQNPKKKKKKKVASWLKTKVKRSGMTLTPVTKIHLSQIYLDQKIILSTICV